MYLYIALYTRKGHTTDSFHWGLVPVNEETDLYHTLEIYQINNPNGDASGWVHDHRTVKLLDSGRFLGCVRLPPMRDSPVVARYIRDFPSQQGHRVTVRGPWSCERWVIQIISDFVDFRLLPPILEPMRPDDNFYRTVMRHGVMMYFDPSITAGTVDVPVVDYFS